MKNSEMMEDMEHSDMHLIKNPKTRYYIYVFMILVVFTAFVFNIVYGIMALDFAFKEDKSEHEKEYQKVRRDMVFQWGVLFALLTVLFALWC